MPQQKRTTRSWYRHPDAVEPTRNAMWSANAAQPMATGWFPDFSTATPFAAMMPFMAPYMGAAASPMMPTAANPFPTIAPWQAWLNLWPMPMGMKAWPMAYALIASGMPQSAAWPTAEAGAHVFEASRKATEGLEQMFANYRSSDGHALAQIMFAGRRLH